MNKTIIIGILMLVLFGIGTVNVGSDDCFCHEDATYTDVPINTIYMWYQSPENLPFGWYVCNASNHAINASIPVLESMFLVGWNISDGDYDTIGENGGEKKHLLTEGEMARHRHTITAYIAIPTVAYLNSGTTKSPNVALNTGYTGGGVAGILEIFFVNHTSSPDLAYSTNNSGLLENWCTAAHLGYTSADDFNTELAALVNFDIVIRVRGNSTVCGEGGIYRGDYLRVNITSTAPLSTSDQYTYGIETRNVSTDPFIWMNFYINDTMPGAGDFVLDKDNSATITEIRLDAFY